MQILQRDCICGHLTHCSVRKPNKLSCSPEGILEEPYLFVIETVGRGVDIVHVSPGEEGKKLEQQPSSVVLPEHCAGPAACISCVCVCEVPLCIRGLLLQALGAIPYQSPVPVHLGFMLLSTIL